MHESLPLSYPIPSHSISPQTSLHKLSIHLLEIVKKPFKQPHAQPRIQPPRRRPDRMHRQLRQSRIHGADARSGRQRRPDGAAGSGVVADLEDLQHGVGFLGDALQQGGAEAVGCGVAVGVGLDGDSRVEAGGVVGEVAGEVVWVCGVADVGGD